MTKGDSELLRHYEDKGTRVEEVLLDRMIRTEHILKHALTQPMTDQEFRAEVLRAHEMLDNTLRQLFVHTIGEGE